MANAIPHGSVPGTPARRGNARLPLSWLLALLVLAGAVVADARFSRTPVWTVRQIEVSGNRSITRAELLNRLHLRAGLPWWRVSLHPVARLRAECPRLRQLRVSWAWPSDLRISVEERESCLRILGPPALEVSADGVLLDPREELDPADLPLLTGSLPAGFKVGARCAFPAAPGWQELLALNDDTPELWRAISEIHYNGGADFQIYLRDGRKVILWETDTNKDVKHQVTQILDELRHQGVKDAVVDLRFRDQAVVRLPEELTPDSSRTGGRTATGSRPGTGIGTGTSNGSRTGTRTLPAQARQRQSQETPNRRHRA